MLPNMTRPEAFVAALWHVPGSGASPVERLTWLVAALLIGTGRADKEGNFTFASWVPNPLGLEAGLEEFTHRRDHRSKFVYALHHDPVSSEITRYRVPRAAVDAASIRATIEFLTSLGHYDEAYWVAVGHASLLVDFVEERFRTHVTPETPEEAAERRWLRDFAKLDRTPANHVAARFRTLYLRQKKRAQELAQRSTSAIAATLEAIADEIEGPVVAKVARLRNALCSEEDSVLEAALAVLGDLASDEWRAKDPANPHVGYQLAGAVEIVMLLGMVEEDGQAVPPSPLDQP